MNPFERKVTASSEGTFQRDQESISSLNDRRDDGDSSSHSLHDVDFQLTVTQKKDRSFQKKLKAGASMKQVTFKEGSQSTLNKSTESMKAGKLKATGILTRRDVNEVAQEIMREKLGSV